MTQRPGSDTSPRRGLEPRWPRGPWLRGIAAATFVLVAIVGAAAPAMGSPCDRKPTKAFPADMCDGKGGKATGAAGGESGNGNGDAYGDGEGNGNAYGHDDDHTGSNHSGGSGNAGGVTPDPDAGGGSRQGHHRREQSDGSADGSRRTRSSRKHQQAQTSDYDDPLRRRTAFPIETTTSRPPALVDLATEADRDVAGSQLSSGFAEVRQRKIVQGVRLLSTALTTAETMAFPISLALLVAVFLIVQAYIDRNDPKLKQAALRREVYDFD